MIPQNCFALPSLWSQKNPPGRPSNVDKAMSKKKIFGG
jgi:hypothetical protein